MFGLFVVNFRVCFFFLKQTAFFFVGFRRTPKKNILINIVHIKKHFSLSMICGFFSGLVLEYDKY